MKIGFTKAKLALIFAFVICALCISAFSVIGPSPASARGGGCPCCSVPASQCVACAVNNGHPKDVAIAWCKMHNSTLNFSERRFLASAYLGVPAH